MAALSTLITPHTGIEPTTSPTSGSWSCHRDSDPSATNFGAVALPYSLIGVLTIPKDHKGKARNGSGHPDFPQGSVLAKKLLQIPLSSIGVQIGDVEAEPVVTRLIVEAPVAAVTATAIVTTTAIVAIAARRI